MLRLLRPRRVVEIGSGFTSALTLDVNDRFLGRRTQLTFVDPYPDRLNLLLSQDDRKQVRIVGKRVQDAPAAIERSHRGRRRSRVTIHWSTNKGASHPRAMVARSCTP